MISAVVSRIRGFALFWWDFIVGDDWRMAAGVCVALAITYGLSRSAVPAWWILPVAVVLLLAASLRRSVRAKERAKP